MYSNSSIQKFELSGDFEQWISPLLYYPEHHILKQHLVLTKRGFKYVDYNLVRQQYNLNHDEMKHIRKKLDGLALLYELEVVAFS